MVYQRNQLTSSGDGFIGSFDVMTQVVLDHWSPQIKERTHTSIVFSVCIVSYGSSFIFPFDLWPAFRAVRNLRIGLELG